ncbi:MAG TPA: hypothetical protein VMS62_09675 [Gemmatimonadales bacterium]|nr:hypothetical protein [Gemmatimonadales bacterium]
MAPRRPVIGVMGAGEASSQSLAFARELGTLLAQRGWIVLTGGRPEGVMAAASAGAKQVPGSLTLGILPGTAGGTGPDVDIAVFTGMGEARNMINVLTSDVVIACGVEGPGTVSEVALALKAEKPVILLGAGSAARELFGGMRGRLLTAATAADAVQLVEGQLRVAPWRRGPDLP